MIVPGSSPDESEADFIDYDGDLDVFVANFSGQDRLYRNDEDGGGTYSFTDVTGTQMPASGGTALDGETCDVDSDGDYDLFVANDDAANSFLENQNDVQDQHAPLIPNVEQAPDRAQGPAPTALGSAYCTPVANSSGLPALMSATGSACVAANDLVLSAGPVPALPSGLFIYSPDPVQTPLGNGNLCVGNQTFGFVPRLPPETSSAGGIMTHALDKHDAARPRGPDRPGSVWHFSLWYRDNPAGGALFNFADGYTITFGP